MLCCCYENCESIIMANNDKNKEKENEYFLDANEDETDIEAVNYDSDSSNNHRNEGGSYDDDDQQPPESFTSQQWPQSYKYVQLSSLITSIILLHIFSILFL